jgi:hypothetical protein
METPLNDDTAVDGNETDALSPTANVTGDNTNTEQSTDANAPPTNLAPETPVVGDAAEPDPTDLDSLLIAHKRLQRQYSQMMQFVAQMDANIRGGQQAVMTEVGRVGQMVVQYQGVLAELSAEVSTLTGKPNRFVQRILVQITDAPLSPQALKFTLHSDTHPTLPGQLEVFSLDTSDPDQNNWHWVPTTLRPEYTGLVVDEFRKLNCIEDKFYCANFTSAAGPADEIPAEPKVVPDAEPADTTQAANDPVVDETAAQPDAAV